MSKASRQVSNLRALSHSQEVLVTQQDPNFGSKVIKLLCDNRVDIPKFSTLIATEFCPEWS